MIHCFPVKGILIARMKEVIKGTITIGGKTGQVKLNIMNSAKARIAEKIAVLESSTELGRPFISVFLRTRLTLSFSVNTTAYEGGGSERTSPVIE